MVDFDTGRMFGLVGSILVLLAILLSFIAGFLGFLIQFVGLILVLVALYAFSNVYGERAIFGDALLSIIIGYGVPLLAIILLFILLIPAGFHTITRGGPVNPPGLRISLELS